ncbi:MAG: type II toxin-antitoxin system VapC family toxin [Candidatus Gracilibacteria bacterium]|jgi:PIN domain nuclease of toxin-antitoxin system
MGRGKGIILDTHIWLKVIGNDKRVCRLFKKYLSDRFEKTMSIFSVWEIGMLNEKKRINIPIDIKLWMASALERSNVTIIPLDTDIALKSTSLRGNFHGDPADRIIVATAIEKKLLLLTEDELILSYAKKGYVKAKSL